MNGKVEFGSGITNLRLGTLEYDSTSLFNYIYGSDLHKWRFHNRGGEGGESKNSQCLLSALSQPLEDTSIPLKTRILH